MTALNCGNCAVAEMRVNGVVYARRNCWWHHSTTCYGDAEPCVCNGGDPADYENIPLIHWVDLPAGPNTITVYGVRLGRSSVESQTEAAVWRKECPATTVNVTCIPAQEIIDKGLCEFERLAALYGAMVGCIQASANCSQGPDTYIAALACLDTLCPKEDADPPGTCDGCDPQIDGTLPGGGTLLNTITFNYAYPVKVRIDWHTAFIQDAFEGCDCPPA